MRPSSTFADDVVQPDQQVALGWDAIAPGRA
jgi:hypothetical protein